MPSLKAVAVLAMFTMVASPVVAAPRNAWPQLPKTFVSNRPATSHDVDAGRAVFTPMPEDQSGMAASVQVPQYALWKSPQGRSRRSVILQAEKFSDGSEVVALQTANGEINIVPVNQVKLLGANKPAP